MTNRRYTIAPGRMRCAVTSKSDRSCHYALHVPMKVRPTKILRQLFGAFAALIVASDWSGAVTPDTPSANAGAQAAEYQRLTTDWACATLRLYLRERSSTNEEAWDWGQGSWRLLEVVRAIQALPERGRCVSGPVLADLKHHIDMIEAKAARVEESYRLFWLMDLLGQSERESKSPRPPLIIETVGKMRAAGWGNDAILRAVSNPTSREAKMFHSSLVTRVQQWDQQMSFPYRDPVMSYLPPATPEQVEALRRAASAATDAARGATDAAKASVTAIPIPAVAPTSAAPK
jgi:hypothetical protein